MIAAPHIDSFPLLRSYLRDEFAALPELAIHPNDEMLQQWGEADERDEEHALVYYFRSGLFSLRAIEQIVAWRFGGWEEVSRLLDFASGYGRLTRLLVQKLPASKITVAEINEEAVRFQRETFGVKALLSAADPADFRCADRFDIVFAGSLFSHLPEPAFRGWLRRLWEVTATRGCLLFSVHNEAMLSERLPDQTGDFIFVEEACSRYLDASEYGNCFVSGPHLEQIVLEELGDVSFRRIPRGLANFQDLCVVAASGELADLAFDPGADGHFGGALVRADGTLSVSGWAAHRSPGLGVSAVELSLDDSIVATVVPQLERPDVAERLGAPLLRSGWECELPVSSLRSLNSILQVRAVSTRGSRVLLWIGTVQTALIRTWLLRREQSAGTSAAVSPRREPSGNDANEAGVEEEVLWLRHQRLELQRRIDAMRRSRFWRAREAWFAVKRALRLTREP